MTTKTHKGTGWTRTAQGYGEWLITPTDESGTRIVAFLSRGSWQNLPNDCRDNMDTDRAVLVSGAPLPEWAQSWLDKAAAASAESGRSALRAALDDADWYQDSRHGW